MKLRGKLWLTSCMILSAAFTGVAAFETLTPIETDIPQEVYNDLLSSAAEPKYYLRDSDGYVAVFNSDSREPARVTEIKTSTLRSADRAMLRRGIPVKDSLELLKLLEDLDI